jgi:hypothetical protein
MDEPTLMTEDHIHRNLFFAVLTELGPVLDHRRIEVDQALGSKSVNADGRGTFGRGIHE